MMMAAFAAVNIPNEGKTKQIRYIDENPDEHYMRMGLKKFMIDEEIVWALNEKNAIRKVRKKLNKHKI